MTSLNYQSDISLTRQFLYDIISRQVSSTGLEWLDKKIGQLSQSESQRSYFLAFGSVPRFISKEDIDFKESDHQTANNLRKGFNPASWTLVQAARVLLTLSLPHKDKSYFISTIEQVFETADMNEQVALYKALPLLPFPHDLEKRAAEGIRTNIRDVFDAVVLDNPFPHDFLSENAWNQMVLKAIFTERPLYRIYGLEARSNPHLAHILSDYAHERWAAHRLVTPELWRAVGPYVDETIIKDIKKLMDDPEPVQQEAAALLCAQSGSAEAKELLGKKPTLKASIEDKTLTWDTIAGKCWG